jgi:molecular chaperone HtpG
MQIPDVLAELINRDHSISGFLNSALSQFEPWVGNSQIPFFPEYTDHTLKHIQEVMLTAVDLATEASRPLMSGKDAAALTLAVCLHDSAMHLTEEGFPIACKPGCAMDGSRGL